MINLDYNNILLTFQQLSGCTVEKINENLPLIDSAKYEIESIIDEKKVTQADFQRCEYAAAVAAFYDYICKQSVCDKIVVTESGNALKSEDYSQKIQAVLQLKNSALTNLREIAVDNDFFFKATEG